MNQQPPSKPFVIDQAHLRRARNLARESGRPVIAELEYLHNGTPNELVQQLARLFGMTAVTAEGLETLQPAFDLLPLHLAIRWQCLLLRDDAGALVGVFADPFDPDLQLWLNSQARCAVLMRIASTMDLRGFLEQLGGNHGKAPAKAERLVAEFAEIDDEEKMTAQMVQMTGDLLRRAMRR